MLYTIDVCFASSCFTDGATDGRRYRTWLATLRRCAHPEKAVCLYMIPICCMSVGGTAMYIDTAGCWLWRSGCFGLMFRAS